MRTHSVLASAVILLLAACGTADAAPTPSPSPALSLTPPVAADCATGISREALPVWARDGFNFDGSGVPHRLGDRGDLMAILFQYPPAIDPENGTKILWVSRLPVETASPLVINGIRTDGATTRIELPNGAGPSGVKIPAAGCWALTMTWSGHTDTMALEFTDR